MTMAINVNSYHECAIPIDVANHDDVDTCFTRSNTITTDVAHNNTTNICTVYTDNTTTRNDNTCDNNTSHIDNNITRGDKTRDKNAAVSSLKDEDVAGTVAFQ